jgi:hypothetical protein
LFVWLIREIKREKKNEEEFALGSFRADQKSIAAIWIACRFGADRIWFAFM